MAQNKKTIFQQINRYFQNGGKVPEESDDRLILTSKNPEDIFVKKLEKQQSTFLGKAWTKANQYLQNFRLVVEAQRMPSLNEYDIMDQYPLIGAALDIFMEESTMVNPQGKVLNINSDSPRVKQELDILFHQVIGLNSVLPMWTRNMCKYGDNFVFVDVDSEGGVRATKQLPVSEIERLGDDDVYVSITTGSQHPVKFRWRSTQDVDFKRFQVVHFRLLTDDKKLPYGVSVLEKVRRIWRNLILTEDAMRTIRLLRASDRRVFYIDVGNIDPNDIESHINEVANRFKRAPAVNPQTGQEDLKYNVLGIDQDLFIAKRGADDGSKIETLPGQTATDIADIEYDVKLLCTGLRVPKTYLNFEETAAEGKSLSMQDIRFARTVNRIQQAMLMGLNQIAVTHLIAKGLDAELSNFTLSLNNPSIQADIIRMDLLSSKIAVFKDLVEPNSLGIAPMSATRAKELVLGMTADEIKEDLNQQRIERAIGLELQKTEQIIKRTGFFDTIDARYGLEDAEYSANLDGTPTTEMGMGGGDMGGSSSAMSMGGDAGTDMVTDTEPAIDADTEAAPETAAPPTETV